MLLPVHSVWALTFNPLFRHFQFLSTTPWRPSLQSRGSAKYIQIIYILMVSYLHLLQQSPDSRSVNLSLDGLRIQAATHRCRTDASDTGFSALSVELEDNPT